MMVLGDLEFPLMFYGHVYFIQKKNQKLCALWKANLFGLIGIRVIGA